MRLFTINMTTNEQWYGFDRLLQVTVMGDVCSVYVGCQAPDCMSRG
jgi:hypothetical protein